MSELRFKSLRNLLGRVAVDILILIAVFVLPWQYGIALLVLTAVVIPLFVESLLILAVLASSFGALPDVWVLIWAFVLVVIIWARGYLADKYIRN